MPETLDTYHDLPILSELRSDLAQACRAQEAQDESSYATQAQRRWTWPTKLATGIAVPALAVAAVFALAIGGTDNRALRSTQHARTLASTKVAGKIGLDGYTFSIPASYQVSSGSSCGPVPSGISAPAILSATGSGCISFGLANGSAVNVPSAAQQVTVGPDQAYWYDPASGETDLYVEIPTESGDDYLVIVTTDRTLQQDVAFAESGLSQSGEWGLPDYQHALPGAPTPPAGAAGS